MSDDDLQAVKAVDAAISSHMNEHGPVASRNLAQAAIAALEARGWQRVPEGCVVAPLEPTEDMFEDGGYVLDDDVEGPGQAACTAAVKCYRAMIAARPKERDHE